MIREKTELLRRDGADTKTTDPVGAGLLTRKRLAEIEKRKTELRAELDAADKEKLAEIEEEITKIEEELTGMVSDAQGTETEEETEDAVAAKIAEIEAELETLKKEETRTRERMDVRARRAPGKDNGGEREKRARALRQTRAVTISGGTIVQPKKTGGINEGFDRASSIVDLVKSSDCRGMGSYDVAYEIASATAAVTAENTEVALSDPTFGIAKIAPMTLATYSEISRECIKLTDLNYLQKVEESAMTALRKKVAEFIANSDALSNTTFFGVNTAPAIDAASDLSLTAIDATTLRKIAMNYGGDEGISGNAILILNKKDLVAFGDVRGTNEKKYVYEITPDVNNPNTGIIQDGGLSVKYVLNKTVSALSAATTAAGAYTMYYGAPECYELGVFSDFTVTVSEDAALRRRMIAILGEVMIGGNVTVYNGFVRVKKPGA